MVTVSEWWQFCLVLDFSLLGSLPACLPELLRYFQSLSSIANQLYRVQRAITDNPHLHPMFKAWILNSSQNSHFTSEIGTEAAEILLHWYSRRFNSWCIYWLESVIDCLQKTGRVDFGTAKEATSSLLTMEDGGGGHVTRFNLFELLKSDTSARVKLQRQKDTIRQTYKGSDTEWNNAEILATVLHSTYE